MSDFDKTTYWKKRINEQLMSLFNDVSRRLSSITDNMEHLGIPADEGKHAVKMIGNGFDELKWSVENFKEKKNL